MTMFVPAPKVWGVLIPGGWPHGTANPSQTLTALSFQSYALLGLFALQALQVVWGGVNCAVSEAGHGEQ
jgi:hypothetical protein